jgi:ribonuclease BN (tRNA processing enzyme)
VYLPTENIQLFKDLLQALSLGKLNYYLEILPIKKIYDDQTIKVSTFRNTHRKDGHSYSFVIESKEKRIIYSGDLGNEFDLLPLLNKEIDLAIIEFTHVNPEKLFQVLKEKNISKLILTHIHYRFYGREREIENLCRKNLSCDVTVASDNFEVFV